MFILLWYWDGSIHIYSSWHVTCPGSTPINTPILKLFKFIANDYVKSDEVGPKNRFNKSSPGISTSTKKCFWIPTQQPRPRAPPSPLFFLECVRTAWPNQTFISLTWRYLEKHFALEECFFFTVILMKQSPIVKGPTNVKCANANVYTVCATSMYSTTRSWEFVRSMNKSMS